MIDHEDDAAASALVRALTAGGTARELRDEEAAVAAFRRAMAGPGSWRRGRLRLASGVGATAVASAFVLSATAVTAAAYTAALPHEAQRAAHHLLHRLGVPGPGESASHPAPAVAVQALPGRPVLQRGTAAHRSPGRERSGAGRPHLEVRLSRLVVEVGQAVRVDVEEQGGLPPGGGAVVQVESRSPGTRAWSVLGRARVSADGVSALVLGRVEHALEVRAVLPVPDGAPLVSAPRELHVRPVLSLRADPSPSGPTGLTLQTDAAQRGRVVVLQEQVAGAWKDVLRAVVGADGSAAFRLPTGHGQRLLRATLEGSPLFDPAVSGTVAVALP